MTVSVLSYGLGNQGSIVNMFKKVGVKCQLISTPEEVLAADKILLPGVGAFDKGVSQLAESNLTEALIESADKKGTPVMGICLGMQLLGNSSEEGIGKGLGLINADCKRFVFDKSSLKVPHMGWNHLNPCKDSPLIDGLDERSRFYFVHSYHMVCQDESDVLATASYGYEFCSMVQRENIIGAQFHPEKSHRFGMHMFKKFAEI